MNGHGFESAKTKYHLIKLEVDQSIILKAREENWCLRSRTIWIQSGDDNTKFHHQFANGQWAINTIWNLEDDFGHQVHSFNHLATLGNTHFNRLYKAPQDATLAEIIRVVGFFPKFVNQEDVENLVSPITMGELEGTLKWFKKDKSLGPDKWSVEFYLAFFKLLGNDLLHVIEECRVSG